MVSRYIKYVMEGSLPDSEVGEVELLEPINLQEFFANPGMAGHQQHARTDVRNSPTNELCLIIVPSRMIPIGILQFLLSSLDRISNIKILRHAAATSSYFAVLEMKDEEAYQIIFDEYDGHVFSPSDCFCCCLLPVMSTSGKVTMKDSEEIVTKQSHTEKDGEQTRCPLCLDIFDPLHPMSLTTSCNHRFHMHCMLRLESAQCPVCRFRHDVGPDSSYHECFECGWQGTSILESFQSHTIPSSVSDTVMPVPVVDLWLCLICGFTGCGASHGGHIQRHYEETLHTYAQNCDTRQVWDFAGDGYVHTLILKDNSLLQLDGPPALSGETFTPHYTYQQAMWDERAPLSGEQETSLVSAKLEAAARYYNQLLAWQLEQNRLLYETRLQRIRDSIPAATSVRVGGAGKTSESSISNLSDTTSSSSHGGSSAMNRARQMATSSLAPVSRGTEKGQRASSWRENMLTSLRSERAKVAKQVEGARARLARAETEVTVLRELNDAYSRNGEALQGRVDAVARALQKQGNLNRLEIQGLEENVESLMTKLDLISKTETGSKHASTGDTATSSAIDEEDEY